MSPDVALILGGIVAITLTVLVYVFIIPESKKDTLNPFFKFLHNLFNFKFLLLEQILKFCYVLSSISCICIGFFMLFSSVGYYYYSQSLALPGLVLMVFGPIFLRIVYESIMIMILIVKNVIQINNKMKDKGNGNNAESPFVNSIVDTAKSQMAQPQAPVQPQTPVQPVQPQAPKFCTKCGSPMDANGNCPNGCQ